MRRSLAATATGAILATAMVMSGCGQAPADETVPAGEAAAVETAATTDATALAAPAAAATARALTPAAPGAPAFAVLYPGAAADGPPTLAQGPSGPGGILTFTTDAAPEAVVAFYRDRAEAAGLTTIASMNQSGASAYSAGDGVTGTGKLLNVVATPVENAPTSVQLSWTNGQ